MRLYVSGQLVAQGIVFQPVVSRSSIVCIYRPLDSINTRRAVDSYLHNLTEGLRDEFGSVFDFCSLDFLCT